MASFRSKMFSGLLALATAILPASGRAQNAQDEARFNGVVKDMETFKSDMTARGASCGSPAISRSGDPRNLQVECKMEFPVRKRPRPGNNATTQPSGTH